MESNTYFVSLCVRNAIIIKLGTNNNNNHNDDDGDDDKNDNDNDDQRNLK